MKNERLKFLMRWTTLFASIASALALLFSEILEIVGGNKRSLLKWGILVVLAIAGWRYAISPMIPWSRPMTPHESYRWLVLRDSCYYLGFAGSRARLDYARSIDPDIEKLTPFFDEVDALYQKYCVNWNPIPNPSP